MYKKVLLTMLATATLSVAVPSLAAATAVPDLPPDVHQAYLADGDGNPESGSFTLSGYLNISSFITTTCQVDMTVDFFDDGTSAITSFTQNNCNFNGIPGCTITVTATNLDWGDRFGFDTRESPAAYHDYIDLTFDTTYGPGCPPQFWGTYPWHGTISPEVTASGGTISYTFNGANSRATGLYFGTTSMSGTLSGSTDTADTQFVY